MIDLISYPRKLRCQEVKLYKDKELELPEPKPLYLICFNKHLFSTYYVPDTMLGSGGTE